MKHEFILEGLNCAHCAAEIEKKIADTDGYENVSFSFATKALSLECKKPDIRADIQELVDSIEDGVTVKLTEDDGDEEEGTDKLKITALIAAAVMFAAAVALHFAGEGLIKNAVLWSDILSVAAVLLSGYDVMIDGFKNAVKLRLDETVLMTVAVIAACALGDFVEAAAVTVLFAIGEILEDKAVERSRRDIKKLADIRPDTACLYENGSTREVMACEVPVGATLMLAPFTRVPLDSVVIEGSSSVDASSLTGESAHISVQKGSHLLSGMMNRDSSLIVKTEKSYSDSAATRIVKLVEESSKNKGSGEKLITRFSMIYTPAVVALGVLIALIPSLITGDWAVWVKRALVCLVASCPCSIVISVPLAYFAGIGAASKSGVLIKGGRYIEALAKSKSFCFDKTGTLTDNNTRVAEVSSVSEYSQEEIISLAASAETHSSHPVATAIRSYADERHISYTESKDFTEIPAKGVSARVGDKLVTCSRAEGSEGLAVTVDGRVIGYIITRESVRAEAFEALKHLKRLGVDNLTMLSGDRKEACELVAEELDLDEYHSSLLPDEKVAAVEGLINKYGDCCFVGDGINDSPVLSRSSCGIAMGMGSDAAIESADAVLSSGNLESLPRAVRLARSTVNTVKTNLAVSLAVKAVVIILAAAGCAPLWLAVLADTGVCLLCVLNSVRLIKRGKAHG